MSFDEFDTAVAAAGDRIGPRRLSGILMLVLDLFDCHPDDDRPPQVIDWDSTSDSTVGFLDDLIE